MLVLAESPPELEPDTADVIGHSEKPPIVVRMMVAADAVVDETISHRPHQENHTDLARVKHEKIL